MAERVEARGDQENPRPAPKFDPVEIARQVDSVLTTNPDGTPKTLDEISQASEEELLLNSPYLLGC